MNSLLTIHLFTILKFFIFEHLIKIEDGRNYYGQPERSADHGTGS